MRDSEPLGGRRLRAALADRWTGGDAERVMVTHGSSEAIWLVAHTLLDPDDEVIVVDPAYQQLYDIAAARGCRITRWDLRANNGFGVDLPGRANCFAPVPGRSS
ncbi:MAG: aminotransferase class I/II-fold pyridoxal phosphate-dependent enzyme [Dermatophilaceae bacterium]